MLALQDLQGMLEDAVRNHVSENYSGCGEYMSGTAEEVLDVYNQLSKLDVLVAYESVGDYGCDSSSFFLFKDKETGMLYELHGSHCSCFGFEGQFQLGESNAAALKLRVQNGGGVFYTGGYDYSSEDNIKTINEYILNNL